MKLSLKQLSVRSFVTNVNKIKGGATCPLGTWGCCGGGDPPPGGTCPMGTRGCCGVDGEEPGQDPAPM